MDELEPVRAALLAKPGAEESFPFDLETMVAKVGGKMFALLSVNAVPLQLSLKVDPDYGEALRAAYPAIRPGYHLNKRHWVTLTLDGELEPALVQGLIDESYGLVVRSLTRAARAQLPGAGEADTAKGA